MKEEFDKSVVDEIINRLGNQPSMVIAILQDIQEKYRYLPEGVFPYLSKN